MSAKEENFLTRCPSCSCVIKLSIVEQPTPVQVTQEEKPRRLLKPKEAAEIANVSMRLVYDLIKSGEWPSIKIANVLRIPSDELAKWMNRELAKTKT